VQGARRGTCTYVAGTDPARTYRHGRPQRHASRSRRSGAACWIGLALDSTSRTRRVPGGGGERKSSHRRRDVASPGAPEGDAPQKIRETVSPSQRPPHLPEIELILLFLFSIFWVRDSTSAGFAVLRAPKQKKRTGV
jgi:hypothetical protein